MSQDKRGELTIIITARDEYAFRTLEITGQALPRLSLPLKIASDSLIKLASVTGNNEYA
ncbi:hypothetical protein [Pantoea sp. Lij88]|jgi:hypothetical protein|uniref:hypothetical protein n=1 Tax=Pantoea sp. Lij88 TaxID=3028622 RepID=UPI0024BB0D71|nr:hypothetical protein [Pantoea sp. Lij88]WHQ73634.1 hypothetical protein PU624_03605 [Pantoea sp. Lij88]